MYKVFEHYFCCVFTQKNHIVICDYVIIRSDFILKINGLQFHTRIIVEGGVDQVSERRRREIPTVDETKR